MNIIDTVTPFWDSLIMHGETLLLIRTDSAANPSGKLALTPARIISVTSASGEIQFEPGRDYLWTKGSNELVIPQGSRIQVLAESALYPPRGSQKYGTCRTREADILFAEGTEYHQLQVAVTYEHAPVDKAIRPLFPAGASLPALSKKLSAKTPISVVLLGDSISVGMNASGLYNAPPHQPAYGPLVANAIEQHFGAPVHFTNLSVGGKDSQWGITQIPAAVEAKPDLVILAFGMNDASGKVTPKQFAANIRQMMSDVQQTRPNVEFILVACMTGNPEWTGTSSEYYPQYRDELLKMGARGITLADVTTIWSQVLSRKTFYDLTGNGLNHPNDFGHRLYAQTLWSTVTSAIA